MSILKRATAQEIIYRVSDQTQNFEVVMPNTKTCNRKNIGLNYFNSYIGRFQCINEESNSIFMLDCSEFENEIDTIPATHIPNTNKDIRCIIGHIGGSPFEGIVGLFTFGEKKNGKVICYVETMTGALQFPYKNNYNETYYVNLQKMGIDATVELRLADIGCNAQTGGVNGVPLWKRRYSEKFEELLSNE